MIKSTNSILKNRIEKKNHNTLAQFSFEYVHFVGKIYLIPYSYLRNLKTTVLAHLDIAALESGHYDLLSKLWLLS